MAEISVRDLRKDYDGTAAVKASSFVVPDGDFLVLLGPSGCGKTTTLRMIAGLESPSGGQIEIEGKDLAGLPARQRDLAFVFQFFALYPHMNVRQNISYPLISQGMRRRDIRKAVARVAKLLQIEGLLGRPVSGLSGGDRQRVALGRAIVREPRAFLMDEPLGALDAQFRERMAEELRSLHDRMGATTVYVTHDQMEAMQMGDRIVVMNQGSIEQIGTPLEIYDTPASRFVADFIGSPPMNLLQFRDTLESGATKVTVTDTEIRVPTMREGFAGDMQLGIRPEHLCMADTDGLPGRVELTEYLGATRIVTVNTAAGRLKARISADRNPKVGAAVHLRFDATKISVFDSRSGRALRSEIHD